MYVGEGKVYRINCQTFISEGNAHLLIENASETNVDLVIDIPNMRKVQGGAKYSGNTLKKTIAPGVHEVLVPVGGGSV